MVRHSSGRSPASYAATRHRSISRGRGSGSASAVTIDQLVGVGDDDPLERVGVVGRAAQRRRARLDPDDAGQGVRRHPTRRRPAPTRSPTTTPAPAQLARLHRDHLVAVDPAGAAAAVDGDDDSRSWRPRGSAGPWCAAGSAGAGRIRTSSSSRSRPRLWPAGPLTAASRSTARRTPAWSWRSSRCRRPRCRARTAPGRPPPSPAGGRRTSWTTPPCSGRGRISRPSSVSAHVTAQRRDLGGQRGQPVGLVVTQVRDAAQPGRGRRRGRRRAVSTGASSPTSLQVQRRRRRPGPVPVTVRPSPSWLDRGAEPAQQVAQRVTGLGRAHAASRGR